MDTTYQWRKFRFQNEVEIMRTISKFHLKFFFLFLNLDSNNKHKIFAAANNFEEIKIPKIVIENH